MLTQRQAESYTLFPKGTDVQGQHKAYKALSYLGAELGPHAYLSTDTQ